MSMDNATPTTTNSVTSVALQGSSRSRLLEEILEHRGDGRTIEELSCALGISRTAVQQHLVALERDGLVVASGRRSTGGRPSRAYELTEDGLELFPRKYAHLAASLLRHSQHLFGEEGLNALLDSMADEVASEVGPRLAGKSGRERRAAVVEILNEFGYSASVTPDGEISAVNCVFHGVARSSRATCRFDLNLIGAMLDSEVEHSSCMLDGAACCLFTAADD